MFDLAPAKASEFHLDADLPIEAKPWQIGLIVGPSGCGKSSLLRQFGIPPAAPWGPDTSIIDSFPRQLSIQDVTGLLSSVGFSSPPAWCRPFHVLSNGERFRVSVARALAEAMVQEPLPPIKGVNLAGWYTLEPNPLRHAPVLIDEFTSVVDRTVAQIGSAATSKAVRSRPGLRLVAASCHYDVVEWLQPDWTFDPSTGVFEWRSLRRRPEIHLEVLRASPDLWHAFRQHHYLSRDLGTSSRCFVGLVDDRPAVFTAVISFPHAIRPGWREHRTVCLPDFQGVGLGNAMSELIAGVMATTRKPYRSVTSHPAMIRHRQKSPLWKMVRRPSLVDSVNKSSIGGFGNRNSADTRKRFLATASTDRMTATFEYVGPARPDLAYMLDASQPLVGGRLAGLVRAAILERPRTLRALAAQFGYSTTRVAGVLTEIGAKRRGLGTAAKPYRYYLAKAG